MKIAWLLFLASYISSLGMSEEMQRLPENNLRGELFNTYDPEVFPLPLNGNKLEINISISIRDLPELNVREYRMILDGVITLSWINHQLSWDPNRYPNISGISVSKHRVWLTELLILPERIQITFSQDDEKVFIRPNGLTTWVMQRTINKECTFNLEEFPRDTHTCGLSVHTHIPGHLVSLQLVPSHVPDLRQNGAWSITNISRSVAPSGNFQEYAYNMNITLKRHSAYFVKKLVRPLLIISTLPIIGVLCPPDSGEKVGFSVTGLLTLIVTLQYTLEGLPESEKDPEVVTASESSLIMMVFHVLLSCLVVWIAFRQGSPPKWLTRIFRSRMMKICYLGGPEKEEERRPDHAGGPNIWVWRKLATLIDWLGFSFIFIVWASIVLPVFANKQKN